MTALPFLMLGTSVFEGAGQVLAGQEAASADKFNAAVQDEQARQSLQNAQTEGQQTEQENARREGAVTAAYGAAGVDPNKGTPLQVMSDVATQGELTRRLQIYQGMVNRAGFRNQATADRAKASAELSAGWMQGAGTILTAATKVAAMGGGNAKGGTATGGGSSGGGNGFMGVSW